MLDSTVEERIATLLLTESAPTVPLSRLYDAISAELGPVCGGADQLIAELRRRPDRFLVIERQDLAELAEAIPPDERSAYAEALRRAGLPLEPHVALVGPPPLEPAAGTADAMLDRVRAALGDLARDAEHDPTLPNAIAEAMAEAAELRRAVRGDADDPGRGGGTGRTDAAD